MWKFSLWAILSVMLSLAFVSAKRKIDGGKTGYGPGDQYWGFVDVREGAHMFYWLYYTTANVASYTDRPLVIWLQGGPGVSSTGFGNFEQLGPLDLHGNNRDTSLVEDMNVLFIDSPVGSGFSYVDSTAYLTATSSEIALDLIEFMKEFYDIHPEFEDVPLHIFGQSYGAKMAAEFALELYNAVEDDEVNSNIASVVFGEPWISPIDSVLEWAPYLLQLGFIDDVGYDDIMTAANLTSELVEDERWIQATFQFVYTQWAVMKATKGVDFYNVLTETRDDEYPRMLNIRKEERAKHSLQRDPGDADVQKLETLMRGPVSKALGIPSKVVWGSQSDATFELHRTDFMKPSIDVVNEILNSTTLEVGVFTGFLDLLTTPSGTVDWIDKLEWSEQDEYFDAPRSLISVDRIIEGYVKSGGNLTTFWINRAGHMVPVDNPDAFSYVLEHFTNFG